MLFFATGFVQTSNTLHLEFRDSDTYRSTDKMGRVLRNQSIPMSENHFSTQLLRMNPWAAVHENLQHASANDD